MAEIDSTDKRDIVTHQKRTALEAILCVTLAVVLLVMIVADARSEAKSAARADRHMQMRVIISDADAVERACKNLLRKQKLPAAEIKFFIRPVESGPPDLERCVDYLLLDRVQQVSGLDFSLGIQITRVPAIPGPDL